MEWLKLVHGEAASKLPAFHPGDEIRVWYRILEQGKERLGQFEGHVIRCRGAGRSRTFTVRRVTHGEGVERVFPFDAKTVSRIEVLRQGKVKRSRLYFLRTIIGKTRIASGEDAAGEKPPQAAPGSDAPPASRPASGAVPPTERPADQAAARS
jgi:large subunit ribosomal protein L19